METADLKSGLIIVSNPIDAMVCRAVSYGSGSAILPNPMDTIIAEAVSHEPGSVNSPDPIFLFQQKRQ